jgi:Tfp pilus assembly protein PilN
MEDIVSSHRAGSMMAARRLSLNLATDPLRNRRFFFWLSSIIVAAILLVSYLAARTYFQYRSEAQKVRASIDRIDEQIMVAGTEEKTFRQKVEEAVRRDKNKVDLVNSIILRKVFSWTELLSTLENCLPDSSYILSLAPTLTEDSRLQMRLKVVSQDLDKLLEFLNKLKASKFSIRIEGEMEGERGLLVSEVSLSYERSI